MMTYLDIQVLKITVMCACIAWVYAEKLTVRDGLLYGITKYYPKNTFLSNLLQCAYCIAGWLSIILVMGYAKLFGLYIWPYLLIAPAVSMVLVHLIIKQ